MPNISTTTSAASDWPRDLDDLRREPARLVFSGDLAALGIVTSYDGLRALPPPLRLPGRRKGWEARAILMWLGAPLDLPAGQRAPADALA